MTEPILELDALNFIYPDGFQGLKNISLSVFENEFVILAGKNGSGKTTLLRHLNGLLVPQSGTIRVKGRIVSDHLIDTRKTVGMVFQDADTQIVGDTVFDEVAFGLENLKMDRKTINKKTRLILDQLDLLNLKNRNPWTLSGGEKRKVAIAGVLVMDPRVVVFDEPFSNLDYPAALQVLSIIEQLQQSGITIIIATHDIETIIACATRMVIMSKGGIIRDGIPQSMVKELESFGIREPCSSRFGQGIQPWHT